MPQLFLIAFALLIIYLSAAWLTYWIAFILKWASIVSVIAAGVGIIVWVLAIPFASRQMQKSGSTNPSWLDKTVAVSIVAGVAGLVIGLPCHYIEQWSIRPAFPSEFAKVDKALALIEENNYQQAMKALEEVKADSPAYPERQRVQAGIPAHALAHARTLAADGRFLDATRVLSLIPSGTTEVAERNELYKVWRKAAAAEKEALLREQRVAEAARKKRSLFRRITDSELADLKQCYNILEITEYAVSSDYASTDKDKELLRFYQSALAPLGGGKSKIIMPEDAELALRRMNEAVQFAAVNAGEITHRELLPFGEQILRSISDIRH